MNNLRRTAKLIVFALLVSGSVPVRAQSEQKQSAIPSGPELTRAITALDAELFDAYNKCDLEKFASFFPEDVEFYHDNDGLSVGKQKLTEALKNNICGKVRREIVADKLEVYPLAKYGAVEIGVHRFQHPGADENAPVGEARFVHIWAFQDGAWKITRVISFDHHVLPK